MQILVTGGAGYIGSVTVKQLLDKNHEVIIIDNLSKGKKELVDSRAVFYEVDLINKKELKNIFSKHEFDWVIHFASAKDAGESMVNLHPYTKNINCFCNLLSVMDEYGCKKIIFSSSAAVYGDPVEELISETHPLKPINYYGFSKLECERILSWYTKLKGFIGINLRYFNVAGDSLGYLDPNAKNIFPIIGEVISKKRKELLVFGDDYETKDGTCIRDYIHVIDLAEAHILALNCEESTSINLGTGLGYSVLDLIKEFKKHVDVPYKVSGRREGDPAKLICSNKKAKELLNWTPKLGLKEMVQSTMEAYK